LWECYNTNDATLAEINPLIISKDKHLVALDGKMLIDDNAQTGMIVFLMLAEAPATLPYYGVAFPRREGLDLYGMAVDHHKPGVAPAGAGLLNAALTASAAARMWEATDAEVIRLAIDNIASTPIGRLEPIDAVVHRWDPMLPQFRAGYLRHLAAFLARGDRSPRLEFAGDYLIGPYTEAALTSGLRAADAVQRELAA